MYLILGVLLVSFVVVLGKIWFDMQHLQSNLAGMQQLDNNAVNKLSLQLTQEITELQDKFAAMENSIPANETKVAVLNVDKTTTVFAATKNILQQIENIFSPAEYITIKFRDLAVDVPVWVVVVVLVAIFFVISVILYCFNIVINLLPNYKKWLKNRQIRQANYDTALAISFLAEGDIIKAAKYATKGMKNSSIQLVNYLSLAAAANAQGKMSLRDYYYAEAHQKFVMHQTAITLAKANNQFEQNDFAGCIATIQQAADKTCKQPRANYLLAVCYQQEQRWQELLQILPKLNKIFPDNKYLDLELQTYKSAITNVAVNNKNKQSLMQFWGTLPKRLRKNNCLIVVYANHLNQLGADLEVEKIVGERLNVGLDSRLIQLYSRINCTTNIQLKKISVWLDKFPENPDLLLAAAKICVKNKLWGKARNYLELSVKLDPRAESFAALGNLLEYLGEQEQSKICFRNGLLKVIDSAAKPL